MAIMPQQWIHLVGIAGAGMSGIARVLHEQGCRISGSDLQSNETTRRLEQLGIEIYCGHSSSNIREGVDLIVVSSAIPQDNPELMAARDKHIPIKKRGQMLANIVNGIKGIAVAGAHGKTTTTSMIYTVFNACKLDPTFIVGGELQLNQLGARLGTDEYAIVEADESDASFLELEPYISVVTNIEDDHLDFYKSVDNIKGAFKQFIQQTKPDGFTVVYGEDRCVQEIIGDDNTGIISYGERSEYDYSLRHWTAKGKGSQFELYYKDRYLDTVELSIPGKHNALNSLAAIAVAVELGLDLDAAKNALFHFTGAKRRFEIVGQAGQITIVDDYAHHPTEIKATIAAARDYHEGRIIVVYQPHRYTRTFNLWEELGEAFVNADLTIFTEIYAAGEHSIPGVTGRNIYQAAQAAGCQCKFISTINEIENYLLETLQEGDMVITMGAGNIWKLGLELLRRLL